MSMRQTPDRACMVYPDMLGCILCNTACKCLVGKHPGCGWSTKQKQGVCLKFPEPIYMLAPQPPSVSFNKLTRPHRMQLAVQNMSCIVQTSRSIASNMSCYMLLRHAQNLGGWRHRRAGQSRGMAEEKAPAAAPPFVRIE